MREYTERKAVPAIPLEDYGLTPVHEYNSLSDTFDRFPLRCDCRDTEWTAGSAHSPPS